MRPVRTSGGGGRAHVSAAQCCCAPQVRWHIRCYAGVSLETHIPQPTPCAYINAPVAIELYSLVCYPIRTHMLHSLSSSTTHTSRSVVSSRLPIEHTTTSRRRVRVEVFVRRGRCECVRRHRGSRCTRVARPFAPLRDCEQRAAPRSAIDRKHGIVDSTDSNNALGTSAGVRGHGAVGRAGGDASSSRTQAPSFLIGMGETAEVAGDGWSSARDGGAGDARAVCRSSGTAWPASQHTAAGRRVRSGRTPTITSPLSASRADEKQLPAAAEQVRERRTRMGGGRGGAGRRTARSGQEGRAAAESHTLVGAHGCTAGVAAAVGRSATVRDGAASFRAVTAARRVTSPHLCTSLPYHAYIPLSGRPDSPAGARVPEYYRLANLFIWGRRWAGRRSPAAPTETTPGERLVFVL
ncbi:unnamed protein product [Pieris brassicae]|uniref:Uncharacterized protein n=1 Tax=Pieris brassicae TaxID=7116 RepID=A0A9P0WYY8_PIEBR|nr:unnamed protein product [Pieris brassicae]